MNAQCCQKSVLAQILGSDRGPSLNVLPDRETSSVAAWLQEHGSSGRRPRRLEVADRGHLLQGLSTPWRRRAVGTSHVCADLPPRTPDRPRLLRHLVSLTVCVNATGMSRNWPSWGCPAAPSAPSAAARNWTARRYAAAGTAWITASTREGRPPERTPSGRAVAPRLTQDELTGTSPVLSATPIPMSALLVVPR